METPQSPNIEPSEPEKEQRFVEAALARVKDASIPKLIGYEPILDTLHEVGLDVDSDGFIIDAESGECVEPYAFDESLFEDIDSPVDDPITAYYAPETDIRMLIGAKERLHLSDMHSVYVFDGEPHPIRDDSMNLQLMLANTGVTFTHATIWSDAADIIRDSGEQIVKIRAGGERTLSMTCFDCGFEGNHTEWVEDEEEEYIRRCPECSCKWDVFSIQTCTECGDVHRWEEITPDDEDGGGMYWEPSCPSCRAGVNKLEDTDRYKEKRE